MNDWIVYINGILMPHNLFDNMRVANSVQGKYLQATVEKEKLKKVLDGSKIQRIDVLEVRASQTVKRYEYLRPDEGEDKNFVNVPASKAESLPERARFKLTGLANSF